MRIHFIFWCLHKTTPPHRGAQNPLPPHVYFFQYIAVFTLVRHVAFALDMHPVAICYRPSSCIKCAMRFIGFDNLLNYHICRNLVPNFTPLYDKIASITTSKKQFRGWALSLTIYFRYIFDTMIYLKLSGSLMTFYLELSPFSWAEASTERLLQISETPRPVSKSTCLIALCRLPEHAAGARSSLWLLDIMCHNALGLHSYTAGAAFLI